MWLGTVHSLIQFISSLRICAREMVRTCDWCYHVATLWPAPVSGCAVPIFTIGIPGDVVGDGEHTDGRHKELSIQIASVPAARHGSTLLRRVSRHQAHKTELGENWLSHPLTYTALPWSQMQGHIYRLDQVQKWVWNIVDGRRKKRHRCLYARIVSALTTDLCIPHAWASAGKSAWA